MIHAYDKNYLLKAQTSLATMLDFAVYDMGYFLDDFYKLFLQSEISDFFENGDTSTISGKTGIELALCVVGDFSKLNSYNPALNRSPEFWTGWSLAYYQWYTGLGFKQINNIIPINEILKMYNPYHETDIMQFVDHMTQIYNNKKTVSNLKLLRIKAGLSQRELSEITKIPIRTIQQYEQRQKNINVAKTECILNLAKTLVCDVEDLLELVCFYVVGNG